MPGYGEVLSCKAIANRLGISEEECRGYLDKMKVKPKYEAVSGRQPGYDRKTAEQIITLYQMTHKAA